MHSFHHILIIFTKLHTNMILRTQIKYLYSVIKNLLIFTNFMHSFCLHLDMSPLYLHFRSHYNNEIHNQHYTLNHCISIFYAANYLILNYFKMCMPFPVFWCLPHFWWQRRRTSVICFCFHFKAFKFGALFVT